MTTYFLVLAHFFTACLVALVAFGGLVDAAPTVTVSPSPSASALPAAQRFPHNLHRLYDGTWKVSGGNPFQFIPQKQNAHPDPALSPEATTSTSASPSINSNVTSSRILFDNGHGGPADVVSHFIRSASLTLSRYVRQMISAASSAAVQASNNEVSFQKTSGFALLTIDNHKSSLHPNLNLVFGDLILRDGAYRTPRDISLHLTGLYELSSGSLFIVGDIIYDSTASALTRLYSSFSNKTTLMKSSYKNITQEAFLQSLSPKIEKYKNQFRMNRASPTAASSAFVGIASQCPFTAQFSIMAGKFDDSVPVDTPNFLNGFTGIGMNIDARTPRSSVQDFENKALMRGSGDSESSTEGFSVDSEGNPSSPYTSSNAAALNAKDELVEMKGRFTSDVCKTKMEIVLSTLDTETLFGKAINYTLLVTIVAFIQVIVLIRQMEMTSTQAGARRISLMTVGLQAVADSYLCLGHLTMGIAVQTLFNAFATAAFFKFICFSIFLMRWMLLIWKARRPSGFSEGWEAMRRELSMLYSRFYGALLIGIFLLYQLQNHIRLFVFGLYSFWLPQIILNAIEDHRRPLLPVYIILTSVTRLAIPLYFWLCPHNFLHIQPQPVVALCLVCWILMQCLMILSQYKFGPRWFIPKRLLPEKYDYFRPIRIENDVIINIDGPSTNANTNDNADECARNGTQGDDVNRPLVNSSSGGDNETRECCICMESVNIHSRERMVTPCNHFFHAGCLERWLEVRLECALCRSPVPPP